jgi:uncharacterized protein (DUF1330 family)
MHWETQFASIGSTPLCECGTGRDNRKLDPTCNEELFMAKAYWISCYREIIDPNKLAAYAKLAGPSIEAGGGRFLARAVAAEAYEAGLRERIVLIEFDSVEKAIATYESPAYRAARAVLEGGVVRDVRIVPGV